MRDNQTTRRMPMIVTAMACAAASMLAGLTLAPSRRPTVTRPETVGRREPGTLLQTVLGTHPPHTIGTAVFIHGTFPKGTERR